ncbi:APC family permease [Amycolatopsis pithecellobii]|uniref:APC family permease n=1 Tax=Amycolatopsis pithecellobii TaxID=664692 RepID=UPI00140C320A|nr:amino acid permease [Amycolatopsis pithecellobii]
MNQSLRRTITVWQGVALYVGAVIGAGVLLLPGLSVTLAGPASLGAWLFDALLGIPLALVFAALAARFPDAGGVATYVRFAFGPALGTVIGWFYFVASATAQALVSLTGAYYASRLGFGRGEAFLLAAGILVIGTVANARGLKVSGRLQLVFSGVVATMLLLALLVSLPRFHAANWTPVAPHGLASVGQVALLIFFAFFGWEAIAHLSEEFRDPARDVQRATILSVGLITLLFVGVVVATIGTGTYGSDDVNRTVIARLMSNGAGNAVGMLTAVLALLISLGTVNAFIATTSRLGYALARDGVFPAPLAKVDSGGVPRAAVLGVGAFAGVALLITYVANWGPETLLVVPNSLVIVTYVIGMAAGARLLSGVPRVLALFSAVLCLALLPFSGATIGVPVVVAALAIAYRRWLGRPGPDSMARTQSAIRR